MMPSCMIVATVGVVTAGDAATKPISASAATVPAAAVAMYAYRWRRRLRGRAAQQHVGSRIRGRKIGVSELHLV